MLNPKLEKLMKEHHLSNDAIEDFKKLETSPKNEIATTMILMSIINEIEFDGEPFIPDEQPKEESDPVNHPSHYTQASVQLEPIDILRYAPFDLGNALKYIIRAGHKGNALTDYQKALKYLEWAKEGCNVDEGLYRNYFDRYGLLLNKFEVFKPIDFNLEFPFNIVCRLSELVKNKIKELKNEH